MPEGGESDIYGGLWKICLDDYWEDYHCFGRWDNEKIFSKGRSHFDRETRRHFQTRSPLHWQHIVCQRRPRQNHLNDNHPLTHARLSTHALRLGEVQISFSSPHILPPLLLHPHGHHLPPPSPTQFTALLASLHHKSSSTHDNMFGFSVPTCDGNIPHTVAWEKNWGIFFGKLLRGVLEWDKQANGVWVELEAAAEQVHKGGCAEVIGCFAGWGEGIEGVFDSWGLLGRYMYTYHTSLAISVVRSNRSTIVMYRKRIHLPLNHLANPLRRLILLRAQRDGTRHLALRMAHPLPQSNLHGNLSGELCCSGAEGRMGC